jgi:RNA polymerase sigma-70 factor, ECF subfamily
MTDSARSRDSRTMTSRGLEPPDDNAPPYPSAALGSIYDANFRYVWRCLKSLGVADSQLDDAAQEVFMVVGKKLSAFDGASNIRTWLYAIALRVARRARQETAQNARRFLSPEPDNEHDPDFSRQNPLLEADMRLDVEKQARLDLARRALGKLDEPKREVFVLICVEGLSAPEVVSILGVPLNTVYSRLRAARQAFLVAARDLGDTTESWSRITRTGPRGAPEEESLDAETGTEPSTPSRARSET